MKVNSDENSSTFTFGTAIGVRPASKRVLVLRIFIYSQKIMGVKV